MAVVAITANTSPSRQADAPSRAPGRTTPTSGTSISRATAGTATALAVLQAATMQLGSKRNRKRTISPVNRVTAEADLVP